MDPVTRESRARIAGKYDRNLENSLRSWISSKTGVSISGDFIDALRNGVILCQLANTLSPGIVTKINNSKLAFKEMENLESFNKACRDLGLNDSDLFVTNDLYQRANPTQVLVNLDALRTKSGGGLGAGSSRSGYSGKQHHVRGSSSNRVFDSKPAQVNLKGGSFGLRNKFEGKPTGAGAGGRGFGGAPQKTPPPFRGGAVGGGVVTSSNTSGFSLRSNPAPASSSPAAAAAGGWRSQANVTPAASSSASASAAPKFCGDCGSATGGKKFCGECGNKLF